MSSGNSTTTDVWLPLVHNGVILFYFLNKIENFKQKTGNYGEIHLSLTPKNKQSKINKIK